MEHELESSMMGARDDETAICLLTCTKRVEVQQRLHLYADYLCHLLNGRIHQIFLAQPNAADPYFFDQSPGKGDCDLIVFGEPDRSLVKRLLMRYDKSQIVNQLATSLLVARQPRHPIKNILLIVRAEESDETAVAWVSRLAKDRDIQVTCLPIIPVQPALYSSVNPTNLQTTTLFADENSTGNYLRRLKRRLSRGGISFQVSLPGGELKARIERALAADDYDLVIVTAAPRGRNKRFFLGELATELLQWLDLPLLIVNPAETI